MRLRTLVMMAAVGTGAWAAEAGGAEAPRVTVCMGAEPGVPSSWPVEQRVSKIFSGIGVRLEWHDGSCPASMDVIKVGFADEAPEAVSASALAYARPYEGTHIVVLYARVKRLQPAGAQTLLAYVLVHEITHIVEGISRHSKSGIMKAQWDDADLYRIRREALAFAEDDVDLIHMGLAARAARLAANGLVQVAAR